MKICLQILSLLAFGLTLILGFKQDLLGLSFFASSSYLVCVYLLSMAREGIALVTAEVLTVFLFSVGMYFLLDTTYMERHLGYKFSYLFIPIWQWTMLLVAGFVVYLSQPSLKKL